MHQWLWNLAGKITSQQYCHVQNVTLTGGNVEMGPSKCFKWFTARKSVKCEVPGHDTTTQVKYDVKQYTVGPNIDTKFPALSQNFSNLINQPVEELSGLHVKYADRTVDGVTVDDQASTVGRSVEPCVGAGTQRWHVQPANTLTWRQHQLTDLSFCVPLNTKQVISKTFHQANVLAWYGKN